MDLDQMKRLAEVAERGTVSAAAKSLRVTQPTLSRSIKRLEDELGRELLNRTANRANLNEAGHIAVACARFQATPSRPPSLKRTKRGKTS